MPPLNVHVDDLGAVLATLRGVAARSAAVEVTLGPPKTFAPSNPAVYLPCEPYQQITDLARQLVTGALCPPDERNVRDFVPHVTLATDLGASRATACLEALADYSQTTTLGYLTILEQDASSPRHPWRPTADCALGRPWSASRLGSEIQIIRGHILDPLTLVAIGRGEETVSYDPTNVAMTVLVGGDVVAAASCEIHGEVLLISSFLVIKAMRQQGIGNELLKAIERVAFESQCPVVRVRQSQTCTIGGFFERFGFALAPLSHLGPCWDKSVALP